MLGNEVKAIDGNKVIGTILVVSTLGIMGGWMVSSGELGITDGTFDWIILGNILGIFDEVTIESVDGVSVSFIDGVNNSSLMLVK